MKSINDLFTLFFLNSKSALEIPLNLMIGIERLLIHILETTIMDL